MEKHSLLKYYCSNTLVWVTIPIVVRSHIREAFELLKSSTKQVFYYDDFLGQTGWDDKLEKNEEQSILDFVKYVKKHDHAKFILTTREYILQQARSVYEKIYSSDFDNAKCIVKLESYSRRDKAHIFYNHLYFSKLPPDHIRSIIHKKSLLEIIDHKNYSPRIIEWMSNYHNVRDCTATEYPKLFFATLSNPREIWRHAFNNHISPASRALILVLSTFPLVAEYSDLAEAFEAYRLQEIKQFGITTSPHEIVSVLDELEGSFIRCDRNNEEIIISFHNPSVRDFIEQHLSENADVLRILCISVIFYDQFLSLCTKKQGTSKDHLISKIMVNNSQVVVDAILRTVCRTAKKKRAIVLPDGRLIYTTHVQTSADKNVAHALKFVNEISGFPPEVASQLIDFEINRLQNDKISLDDLNVVLNVSKKNTNATDNHQELVELSVKKYEDLEGYDELENIVCLQNFIQEFPGIVSKSLVDKVKEIIQDDSELIFDNDISNASDDQDIDRIRGIIYKMESVFDVSLDYVSDWLDDKEREIQTEFYEPPDDMYGKEANRNNDVSDTEIVSIFESFKE